MACRTISGKEQVDIVIKSMTGFGRFEADSKERKIIVEMKAVNHRYLELSVKMPKKLSFFEAGIRTTLKKYISRGKVDMYVTYEDYTEGKTCVKYNDEVAKEYYDAMLLMSESFGIPNDVTAAGLSRLPEVFTLEEQSIDEAVLWEMLEKAVTEAASRFVETRIKEGELLKQDIISKLDHMLELVDFIEERSPEIIAQYRNRLLNKVHELLDDNQIDESRLVTEVTMFADRICVDEETVRLRAHILSMKDTLGQGENIGRKLDFIAQEMNREANTILSKANDLPVTDKAIDLKTEIEKVREQIQNIE